MTKMAAMPIYGKNPKTSSYLEPIGRYFWILVYSLEHSSTTTFDQIMTLSWPLTFLRKSQL